MISCKIKDMRLFEDDFERYTAFCRTNSLSLMDGVGRLMDMAGVASAEEMLADIEREKEKREMQKNDPQYLADLISRAEAGDSASQAELAHAYPSEICVSKDYSKAAFWAEKAAAAGECAAELLLGSMYMTGHGVPKDYAKARELLSRSSEYGNPLYMVLAGLACLSCARSDSSVPKSENPVLQEAVSWFSRAADLRCPEGEFMLGLCYLKGYGVEEDAELGKIRLLRGMFKSGDDEMFEFGAELMGKIREIERAAFRRKGFLRRLGRCKPGTTRRARAVWNVIKL